MGLIALANMLLVDPRDAEPVPIPAEFMPALELSRQELLKALRLTNAVGDPTWGGLTSLVSVGSRWDQLILLLPALLLDHNLWRGAQYCIGSMSLFIFMGDDLSDTLRDRATLPDSPYRVVDAESALWLAYKAVESVIGGPPSDRRKLEARLGELDLVDFPGVWRNESSVNLATRVTDFVTARDRRAAHGRHHVRRKSLRPSSKSWTTRRSHGRC
jgi:hypothetical protein